MTVNLPPTISLREVGLRDGLQSRTKAMSTEMKAQILRDLVAAGFTKIEAAALVHPAAMPHMADAEAVLDAVGPLPKVTVAGLALNARGLERALALHEQDLMDEVHFLHATTEAVLRANGFIDGLEGNQARIGQLAEKAKTVGLRTMCFISASFGCSIEGFVDPNRPLELAHAFLGTGLIDEICFSDSSGQASPRQVHDFFELAKTADLGPVTVHFHDSRGAGLANIVALLDTGMEVTLDCAFAGLGGDVPFLPEAAGNVCTEDLVAMLDGCGIETGICNTIVIDVARRAAEFYGEHLPGRTMAVGPVSWLADTRAS